VASAAPAAATPTAAGGKLVLKDVQQSLNQFACSACHGMDTKMVGPSFKDIVQRYASRADGEAYLAGKIKNGGQGVWGQIPMPAQAISEAESKRVAQWLMQGAAK
jgi:S-disulfanyl-L-cysteine oxidoreductase SoxD